MSIAPLITFKAGLCEVDTAGSKPYKVKPQSEPGYLFLYTDDDDLVHFCWRKRESPLEDPQLDLLMMPTDGSFMPYDYPSESSAKTNGRIVVLKFESSSARHLFWLQSKPQAQDGLPSSFSARDKKIVEIVHRILQGDVDIDVTQELAAAQNAGSGPGDDDDEDMEDADATRGNQGASGGAGADATGGDPREEGEAAREGGADGARAAPGGGNDAADAVRNFLQSLGGQSGQRGQQQDKPYPYLNHLLPTSITVPLVDSASEESLDSLLSYLPQSVIVIAAGSEHVDGTMEPSADAIRAAKASLSSEDKRSLLKRVLRSPQLHQALSTLTMALRDGGLPGVAEALGVQVENGGYMQGGGMPLGGGFAMEAFVEGVKKTVQKKQTS